MSSLCERRLSDQAAARSGSLGIITAVAITGAVCILCALGLDTVQKEPRAPSSVPLGVSQKLWERIKASFSLPTPIKREAGPMRCPVWADLMPLLAFFFLFPFLPFLSFFSIPLFQGGIPPLCRERKTSLWLFSAFKKQRYWYNPKSLKQISSHFSRYCRRIWNRRSSPLI